LVKKYRDAEGKLRVAGLPALKESQSYPAGFGKAVQKLSAKHDAELKTTAKESWSRAPSSIRSELPANACDRWPDAGLDSVLKFLAS
jgi:hypothetical protein